jgi:hypothetical protein
VSDENPEHYYSIESPSPIHLPAPPADCSPYCCVFSIRPATPLLDRFPARQATSLFVWVLAESREGALERARKIAQQLPCEIAGSRADVIAVRRPATNPAFLLQEQAARRDGFSVLLIGVPKPRGAVRGKKEQP